MKYLIRTGTGHYWRKQVRYGGLALWNVVLEKSEAHRFWTRKMASRFIKDGNYKNHTIEEVDA